LPIKQDVIDRLMKEQSNHCCLCSCPLPPYEVHHAIYTRDKKFSKWLDTAENLVLLCPACHQRLHGDLTSWFMRSLFWTRKLEKGYDMYKWHEEIPMLIKDKFYEFDYGK
jgi:uncharacterized protein YbaR (Trm112 family)